VLTVSTTSTIAPAAITFDASQSADADGTVAFYYWDFGDYTGDSSGSLKTATKTYTVAGVYTVSLTVVDDKGFSSTTSQTISIADSALIKAVSPRAVRTATAWPASSPPARRRRAATRSPSPVSPSRAMQSIRARFLRRKSVAKQD
jgi:PKD repeat protein